MRVGLHGRLEDNRGFILPLTAIILIAAVILVTTVMVVSQRTSKTAIYDYCTAQARYAADTGIERIKLYFLGDSYWSDGSVAEGPVDKNSTVEKVLIEHQVYDNKEVAVITSTGRCRDVKKTVRVVMEISRIPLITSYGGGLKVLNPYSTAKPDDPKSVTIQSYGRLFPVNTDLLINGNLYIEGYPLIGNRSKPRHIYVAGSIITDYAYNKPAIIGDAYAAGTVNPEYVSGTAVSGYEMPEMPDINDVDNLVSVARELAKITEKATKEQHYFPSSKVFKESDIKKLKRGVYFVEGDAYIRGDVKTNSEIAIVASRDFYIDRISYWIYPKIKDENLTIIAGRNVIIQYARTVDIALAVAKDLISWTPAPGGKATLRYGAFVGSRIYITHYGGTTTLEFSQNDNIDFDVLAAPIHTGKIIERTEID